ncbi:MAG: hypothetical protein J0L83_06775 [Chitinophagales bacterium]|nr:hypothetical protein [Chitinophagales bacterium]
MVLYYVCITWIVHRSGYEHTESLFYAEKLKLLFEAKQNKLVILGTTFPSLVFLSNLVFTPLGYLFAPVAASILVMSILYYFILRNHLSTKLPMNIYVPMVTALFMFHPGMVFAAVSGRSIAMVLLFFYLVYRSFFNYYRSQTTFYLSLSSIYLACLIFSNYNFIWLLIAFFPFIVLISLEGIKISKDQPPVLQYYESLNNRSLRRKLANRTAAIYIIIFLLPLGAIYLFRTLNQSHAGNPEYFLSSQYSNWAITGLKAIDNLLVDAKGTILTKQTQIVYHFFILLMTPLFVVALMLYKGKIYELMTIISPFILLSVLLIANRYYLSVEYLLIFLLLAVLILIYYAGKTDHSFRRMRVMIFTGIILSIIGGFYYFSKTNDFEEKNFYHALLKGGAFRETRAISEEKQIAQFIQDVTDGGGKVMIDDAAAYGIVAHLESLNNILLPLQPSFVTVVENPTLSVNYLCIAKRENRLHNFTVLNAYNIEQMRRRIGLNLLVMFETPNWVLYKISN